MSSARKLLAMLQAKIQGAAALALGISNKNISSHTLFGSAHRTPLLSNNALHLYLRLLHCFVCTIYQIILIYAARCSYALAFLHPVPPFGPLLKLCSISPPPKHKGEKLDHTKRLTFPLQMRMYMCFHFTPTRCLCKVVRLFYVYGGIFFELVSEHQLYVLVNYTNRRRRLCFTYV